MKDIYVVSKNSSSRIDAPMEVLFVTLSTLEVFDFDIREKFSFADREDIKCDVWRDGEVYNTFLWDRTGERWVEQTYPETKKAQERREDWNRVIRGDV